MIICAALTLLWREHSYRTLAEEFQAPFAALLELTRGTDDASNAPRRTAARIRVLRSIQVMLGVANDALLEGRTAGIDPNSLIEALDTLLRLAFIFGGADRVSTGGEPAISPAVTNAVRFRFQAWLEKLRAETESGAISPAPLRRMVLEAAVPALDPTMRPNESRALRGSTSTELEPHSIR
jgi:hypothetical protein